jgi:DNA-binding Lrp family transcriptional regulator
LVLRPKQEQLLEMLRTRGSMAPAEIWEGLSISKQGAMDLLRPLMKAGLIKRVGTLKHGRYLLK